jgi:hypothetical protein
VVVVASGAAVVELELVASLVVLPVTVVVVVAWAVEDAELSSSLARTPATATPARRTRRMAMASTRVRWLIGSR